ncbi:hypothetical protein BVRB_000210 [Beta vulgaris subsp. vulgaris]|uniref:Uncharacterized protein n=1 Tax=Beta vulgaris subsp. vulgaris TaxID=3555 RepID=A0A0J8B8K6_BETVV|nr:uncharacterized protein LOC104883339 [Beta vulgaris subsp. vulgaris]KMS96308.1 hypothetical protein BVRB_000210 [Beta vulgaris subsp. vulgaris]
MASAQQGRNIAQLNDKQKAKVAKAIIEAKKVLANKNQIANSSQDQLAKVAGIVHNDQSRPIMLLDTHDYLGKFAARPPQGILPLDNAAFVHEGVLLPFDPTPPAVSKAAIKYTHKASNENSDGELGWLLAWYKPLDAEKSSKIYVEAGSFDKISKMGWPEIEEKLNASGNTSRYWDSDTPAAASARIEDEGNKIAFIGCDFEIINSSPN